MLRRLAFFLILGVSSHASALTPDELKAQLEERSSSLSGFEEILADPNPQRVRAAIEIMLDSGDDHLIDIAINAGLQSSDLETRQTALNAFLSKRPSLVVSVQFPASPDLKVESEFRRATRGSMSPDGNATFGVNVGAFSEEFNCYLHTGWDWCAAQVTPDGLIVSTRNAPGGYTGWVRSNLFFIGSGVLKGPTAVERVNGSFPSELTIAN